MCVCVCVQKWIKQFLHTSTSTLHVYHGGFMVGETAPVPKQKQIDTKMDKNSFRTHTPTSTHSVCITMKHGGRDSRYAQSKKEIGTAMQETILYLCT